MGEWGGVGMGMQQESTDESQSARSVPSMRPLVSKKLKDGRKKSKAREGRSAYAALAGSDVVDESLSLLGTEASTRYGTSPAGRSLNNGGTDIGLNIDYHPDR